MSDGAKNKPEGLLGLTQSEARLILLGVLCSDASGKIDYEKLAAKAPYKNVASASTSYRNAKRRFDSLNDSGADASGGSVLINSPTKTTPANRKRGRPASINQDAAKDSANGYGTANAGDGDQTPSTAQPKPKRQRRTPAKDNVVVKAESEGYHVVHSPSTLGCMPSVEPAQLDSNDDIKVKSESGHSPTKTHLKSEEDIMTQLNVDAEFADMEHSQKLTAA